MDQPIGAAVSSVPKVVRPWEKSDGPVFKTVLALTLDDHLWIDTRAGVLMPAGSYFAGVGFAAAFFALFLGHKMVTGGYRAIDVLLFVAVPCGIFAGTAALLPVVRWGLRKYHAARLTGSGHIGKQVHLWADAAGLNFEHDGNTAFTPWSNYLALEEDERLFAFWLSPRQAHIWPSRLFGSEAEKAAFRKAVAGWAKRPFAPPQLLSKTNAERRRAASQGKDLLI